MTEPLVTKMWCGRCNQEAFSCKICYSTYSCQKLTVLLPSGSLAYSNTAMKYLSLSFAETHCRKSTQVLKFCTRVFICARAHVNRKYAWNFKKDEKQTDFWKYFIPWMPYVENQIQVGSRRKFTEHVYCGNLNFSPSLFDESSTDDV